MGKKFNEQMICCCNLSRKWWWGSIHVFDSPIKFLNYLDKEGSIDFDTTNIEKVTVAYLCNRVGDDGGEWEGTDSHWAVCNPTDKGAFAVWEINLSDSSNPTPASVLLPPDELLTDEEKINITNDVCKKNNTSWDEAWELPKLKTELIAIECYKAVAKAQLLKCQQSESAEIASLQADIEELNILSRCNSEVYDTRIKELETLNYKQSQMKCNRCPYNNPQESAIRADQPQHYVDANNKRVKRGVR